MRTIEEVIEELNKELFSIGEQVGEEIKSGKINDTPYSRGMLQGIAMVAVCVENRGNEILEIHKAEKQKWIPVSERLPKPFSYVNCTCRSLIDDRAFWVVETCYVPQPKNSPYSDWGNIPMLNHGDCTVVAWMYRDIPKPYKAESDVEE